MAVMTRNRCRTDAPASGHGLSRPIQLFADSDSIPSRRKIVRANGFPMHFDGRSVADSSSELDEVGIATCTYLERPCGACRIGANSSLWTDSTNWTAVTEPGHDPLGQTA